jgi:hypothetical protein
LPLASHVLVPVQVSGSSMLVTFTHAPVFAAHARHAPVHVACAQQ